MILSRHISELVAFKTPSLSVLSIYLDLEAVREPVAALKALRKTLDDAAASAAADDFAKIERELESFDAGDAKGLAIFSSRRFGLFRVCALPQRVKPMAILEHTPSLKPFLNLIDQHQRYGVALVGGKSARFLEFFMGGLRELPEHSLSAEDAPGGKAAFYKAVAEKVDALARSRGFQRLIVGADADVEKGLSDQLPRALLDNLIVDAELRSDMDAEEVRGRISDAERQARQVREQVLAHRLLDTPRADSARGLRDVLFAVSQNKIKTLLVREGFAKLGRRCPSCGFLSQADPKCLNCRAATVTVFNLIEEIVARALEQGAEVFRLQSPTPLDNIGHIGAELRRDGAPSTKPQQSTSPADPATRR